MPYSTRRTEMSGPQQDPEELTTAREVVRDTLGGQLAEEASDAYCLAVYRRSRSLGAEARTFAGVPAPAAATVDEFRDEFRDESPGPALPRLAERPDWARERAAVESLAQAAPSGAPVRLRTVLRQKLIEDSRAGYQRMGEVYQELERLARAVGRPGLRTALTTLARALAGLEPRR
jgi:serine protease AprX